LSWGAESVEQAGLSDKHLRASRIRSCYHFDPRTVVRLVLQQKRQEVRGAVRIWRLYCCMLRFLGFRYDFIPFGWSMRHHVPRAVSRPIPPTARPRASLRTSYLV
jgi:hypothetical protein